MSAQYLSQLLTAIKNKNADEIRTLLEQLGGYVNNNIPDDTDGSTPLHKVAKLGDQKILKLFVCAINVDVNVEDYRGMTALHYVLKSQKLEEAEILIDAGARLIADRRSTFLHEAAKSNIGDSHLEIAELLLKKGVRVNAQDKHGNTALHYLVNKASNSKMIKLFLKFKARVYIENKDGCTPLHNLLEKSPKPEIVQLFLDSGADVDMQDYTGRIPLFKAIENNNTEIVQLLLEYGSDVYGVDDEKSTPLHLATKLTKNDNNFSTVELLLKNRARVNVQDNKGKTPLHYMVSNGNSLKTVKLLLNYKPGVNIKDRSGRIPLFNAVERCGVVIVQLLIDLGSDVKSVDNRKLTPLHVVKDAKVFKCLVKSGADVNALDAQGRSPLLVSLQTSGVSKKTIQYLLNYSDINLINKKVSVLSNIYFWRITNAHIAKLQALDVPINPKITDYISSSAPINDYFVKCMEELTSAKNTKLQDCWVSFFNLLTDSRKKLKNYAGNQNLVEVFKKSDCIENYPVYGSMMQANLEKGIRRRKLFDQSTVVLSKNWPIFGPTHLIIRDVLDCCLSIKDLSKFCK